MSPGPHFHVVLFDVCASVRRKLISVWHWNLTFKCCRKKPYAQHNYYWKHNPDIDIKWPLRPFTKPCSSSPFWLSILRWSRQTIFRLLLSREPIWAMNPKLCCPAQCCSFFTRTGSQQLVFISGVCVMLQILVQPVSSNKLWKRCLRSCTDCHIQRPRWLINVTVQS